MTTRTLSPNPKTTEQGTRQDILRQVLVVAGFVTVIVGNTVAEAVPINAQTSAEISNRLPILITPANYAFAIWGAIWLGLAAFSLFQALPAQRTNPTLRKIGYPFVLSCVLNVVWLVIFHFNSYLLSCFIIGGLAATLAWIYLQVGVGRKAVSAVERWCTHVPFSLYLGWVSVATIVNIAYTLYDSGFRPDKATQEGLTVMMLGIAAVLGTLFVFRHKEIALIGAFIWAFTAIGNAQTGVVLGTNGSAMVTTAAFALAAGLALIVVLSQGMTWLNTARAAQPVVVGRRSITTPDRRG
jgi:tryptophan-rich sensory protein